MTVRRNAPEGSRPRRPPRSSHPSRAALSSPSSRAPRRRPEGGRARAVSDARGRYGVVVTDPVLAGCRRKTTAGHPSGPRAIQTQRPSPVHGERITGQTGPSSPGSAPTPGNARRGLACDASAHTCKGQQTGTERSGARRRDPGSPRRRRAAPNPPSILGGPGSVVKSESRQSSRRPGRAYVGRWGYGNAHKRDEAGAVLQWGSATLQMATTQRSTAPPPTTTVATGADADSVRPTRQPPSGTDGAGPRLLQYVRRPRVRRAPRPRPDATRSRGSSPGPLGVTVSERTGDRRARNFYS